MVMTYDNDNWGIGYMNLVTAHETGHIFGALDEYASSGCSTADSWGYLNVANASCNNGGVTTDKSIMGEGSEQVDPSVDVSTSARGAIGWRNPAGAIVDVVRTATVSLTPYTPDPTSDNTPTYSASAGNTPYPPGGCNTIGGFCYVWPSPVTVSKVAGAEWNLDGGGFTSLGVVPTDGAFDEETDPYTFTPQSPVASGTRTFGTRSTNNFGHISSVATDTLTITPPDQDGDGIPDALDNCPETYDTGNGDNDGDAVPGTQPPPGATWGGDVCDADDDNDTVLDGDDAAPLDPYVCQDLDADTCDDCSVLGVADPSDDGTDTDVDGLCDAGDPDDDNDTVLDGDDAAPLNPYVCQDLDADTCDDCTVLGVADPSDDGTDTDVDGLCDVGDPDDDNDGFDDDVETYLGTDPLDDCPNVTGTPGLCPGPTCDGHDAWPLDVNVDKAVTVVGDALNFRDRIGAEPADPEWLQRLDLNMDNYITVVGDVLLYTDMLGATCT